ncbi:MAG: DUF5305 domain-containing protein [Halobacteriaceae archaeon]
MSLGMLRLRATATRHFGSVLAVSAVLVLLGAWLVGGAYLVPGSHPVERTGSTWAATGNFSHEATVVGNATAFEPGSVVEDRTVYFQSVMPELEATHSFVYTASGNGSIDAVVASRIVVEGVSGAGEGSVTYWSVGDPLATHRVTNIQPGEVVRTTATVNVSAAMMRGREIAKELGTPSALLRARIVVDVRISGRVNDHPVNETLTYALPMTFRGGIYRIESPVIAAGQFRAVETVTVTDTPGFVGGVVGPVFVVAGLVGGGGLLLARRRDQVALTDRERAWLRFRIDRSEYDDWISRVSLPDEAFEREVIEAETLADLVDVAIDADEPVLEDREAGGFHVLHDGYRYTFAEPAPPASVHSTTDTGPTRHRNPSGVDVSALREQPYQDLRKLAAREGLDVGASPSKADLVDALARAGVTPDEEKEE